MSTNKKWRKVEGPKPWRPKEGDELEGFYGGTRTFEGTYGEYEVVIVYTEAGAFDDRTSAKALEAAGFEMVASGANGAPQGGCWSYWRAPSTESETSAPAIEIRYVESETGLYHRYSGQTKPQDCYVWIDCESERMGAAHNTEIGNAVPVRVYNGHQQRFAIPALKADAANALLDEIAPLAARVVAGYSSEWDGSNEVAEFNEDADAALDAIESLCQKVSDRDDEDDKVNVWEASQWFASTGDALAQCRALGIGPNTTDEELDAIESHEEAVAKGEGVDVLEGLSKHLRTLREKAIDAAPTEAHAESGTQRFEATLDRDAREVSILCTETSDSFEDDAGVTQWPEAQPADLEAVRAAKDP